MAEDTRLGIQVTTTESGAEAVAGQIRGLQRELRRIVDIQSSISSVSTSTADALRTALAKEEAAIKSSVAALQASLGVSKAAAVAADNVAAAVSRQGAAAARAARDFETSAALILRAQRGIEARSVEPFMGRAISTAQLIQAQRAVNAMRVREAQAASLRSRSAEPLGVLTSGQILLARQRFDNLASDLKSRAAVAGEEAGRSFFSRFFSPRTMVTFLDEGLRGQRGQMAASVGAAFNRTGLGISPALGGAAAGVGAAVIGAMVVTHTVKEMSELAEKTDAAAHASGIAFQNFARLQGALQLTGLHAQEANATFRTYANNLEHAMANPASRSAHALHAIGIAQTEINRIGQDSYQMFLRVRDALSQYEDTSTKAAAENAIFGRSDEGLNRLLGMTQAEFEKTMRSAEGYSKALGDNKEKLEEMGRQLRELGLAWETLKLNLTPVFTFIIEGINLMVEKLKGFIGAVKAAAESVGQFLPKFNLPSSGGIFDPNSGQFFPDKPSPSAATPSITLPDVVNTAKKKVPPFDIPKGANQAHKEYTGVLDLEHAKLRELQRDHELFNRQQAAGFDRDRLQARIQRGDRDISPLKEAEQEFQAYAKAGQAKIQSLEEFQRRSDEIHDIIIAEAKKVYGEDLQHYQTEVQNKINADKEFLIQHQEIENQITNAALRVVQAHKQAVDQVLKQWGNMFDKIGADIETTIGAAIKSAFAPMKPEFWWSTTSGPHGQPLMVPHRIDPTMQLAGSLGMSIIGDLGKQLMSSITTSIGKSIFGSATTSIGEGIAKAIGIGGPGGLFGTGLGAVKDATESVTLSTAGVALNTAGVSLTAAATALTGAAAALSVGGAASGAGGLAGFGPVAAVAAFAKGGWAIPSFAGGGAIPAFVHPGEHVIPKDIAQRYESGAPGGGDMHLHFHGPADAPSINRWFTSMMSSNPGVVKNFIRQSQLTYRNI